MTSLESCFNTEKGKEKKKRVGGIFQPGTACVEKDCNEMKETLS